MSGAIVFVANTPPLNFGNATVGTTVNSTLTLQNNNNTFIAIIQSHSFAGADAADFGYVSISPGSGSIGPHGGQAIVTLSFTPTSARVFNATVDFVYDDGNGGTSNTGNFAITGTGVSAPGANEVTALVQNFRYLLVPSLGTTGKVLSYYDTTSFDDATDNATYVFKAEDIAADRVPTVRRVIITYIDLGVASLIVTVSGVNDLGASTSSQATVSIGTAGATGVLATVYADLAVTCYRPQLTIVRNAAGGPVAISHVVMTGTVEREVTL